MRSTPLILLFTLLPALAMDEEPVLVQAQAFETLAIYPERTAPATVLSLNDSAIAAEVNGRIESIAVRAGDAIAAGGELVRLDCRDHELQARQARARVSQARAARELAERQLERAESLRASKNISEELLDQRSTEVTAAKADYASAHADLSMAELAVERCVIQAPFNATVLERIASEGELATPGTVLLRLLESERLEVSASVPVTAISSLQNAEQIWLDDDGGRYPLKVRTLVPAVDTQARAREVRLDFTGNASLPGVAGRILWRASAAHLPAGLIVRRDDQLGVFVADGKTAHFVALPGAREGQPAAAAPAAGKQVITTGRYGLQDGTPVRLKP